MANPNKSKKHIRRTQASRTLMEAIEPRVLMSADAAPDLAGVRLMTPAQTVPDLGPGIGISVQDIRRAYGIDQVMFGDVVGDGSGQTIAVIDVGDAPNIVSDLHTFDVSFGLSDPVFTKVSQSGSTTSFPATDTQTWGYETALDVEWAHAIAPGANILLVEATNTSNANLLTAAVNTARNYPGVSVVSMSFGGNEGSSQLSIDNNFTTPTGHANVTFLASTGDDGKPGGYPAYSKNVIGVGGTSLSVNSDGSYNSESAWSESGGGISTVEAQPQYQSASGIVTQSTAFRTNPDVSFDADPNTGVAIYSNGNWFQVGGTSFSSPAWGGIIAIADQGRALAGLPTLDGPTDTLPMLYAMPSTYFNDVTAGNNGFSAGTGYDLATGRGTPKANLLIPALVSPPLISFDMSTDPGWTLDGSGDNSWQYGTPTGGGSHGKDPTSGHTGTDVIGFNLNGDYASSMTTTLYATTPTLDLTNYTDVKLTFWRRLGVQSTDRATIQVWDGATWTTIYSNPATATVSDTSWVFQEFALPASTYNNPDVQIRWGMGPSDATTTYPGWNIDDVSILATQLATISGQVFVDANGDGNLDNGEQGINGVNVYLDLNNNGIFDWGEPLQTTAGNGNYVFKNLTPGTYTVREETPVGYVQTGAISNPAVDTGIPATGNLGLFPTTFSGASTFTLAFNNVSSQDVITGGALPYSISPDLLGNLTFNAGAGSLTLVVDFSGGNPIPAGGITLAGGVNNILKLEGGAESYLVTDTQIIDGDAVINYANVSDMTLGAGNFEITVPLTLSSLRVDPNAVVTLTAGSDTPLVLSSLSMDATSALDLNDNALLVNAADPTAMLTTFTGLLATGRDGGAWDGLGIRSAAANAAFVQMGNTEYTALALALNSALPAPLTALDGVSVNPAALVIKYTYAGDANLDGTLSLDDYLAADSGFFFGGTGYTAGDFDYSGTVDSADFAILDQNFGRQGAVLSSGGLKQTAAVTEISGNSSSSNISSMSGTSETSGDAVVANAPAISTNTTTTTITANTTISTNITAPSPTLQPSNAPTPLAPAPHRPILDLDDSPLSNSRGRLFLRLFRRQRF